MLRFWWHLNEALLILGRQAVVGARAMKAVLELENDRIVLGLDVVGVDSSPHGPYADEIVKVVLGNCPAVQR